ncbi:MAG: tetratricopeptide repeat protein [Candidatus Didemnitutus sp.]|nr:tetratricopeptide repeat protein [Candidatus Didemnitutus sp.]
MSNVPSATPPHDPANPPPPAGADAFAADVQTFWEKNRSFVLVLVAAVLLGLIGREGWQWFQTSHEQSVQEEYVKAGDNVGSLAKFAAANKGHALAGVALLRVADDNYTKNDFKSAAANYTQATETLASDALKSRAKLGAAMSQIAGGDRTAGEAALKAISADTKAVAATRAEAAYHLAVLLKDAGRADDARKAIEDVKKIEANGLWAQRAFALSAQLDAGKPAAPATTAAPTVEFKPKG